MSIHPRLIVPPFFFGRQYVGMGTLCGSTIMLLTIAWTGGLIAGRTDIVRGKSVDHRLTRKWDLLRTGVTTMRDIRVNAVIMVVTLLPYFVIQIVSFVNFKKTLDPVEKEDREDEYVLASFVVTCVFFVVYSVYMVLNTTMQDRRIKAARRRLVMQQVADLFVASIREKGDSFDVDGEQFARSVSLRAGTGAAETGLTESLLRAVNDPRNGEGVDLGQLTEEMLRSENIGDMYALVDKWKRNAQRTVRYSMRAQEDAEAAAAGIEDDDEARAQIANAYATSMSELGHVAAGSAQVAVEAADGKSGEKGEDDDDGDGGDGNGGDDGGKKADSPRVRRIKTVVKACVLLVLGAGGAAVFSDPMVDTINRMSRVMHIQPFFISFIVTPFASNASELIASLYFCAKKSSKSVSVAMAAVYGAVTMNSTLNLGILLLLMYRRDIFWAFTAEALPMLFTVFVVGIFAAVKDTFTALEGVLVLLLYPLSLGLTYLFQRIGLDRNIFPPSSSSSSIP